MCGEHLKIPSLPIVAHSPHPRPQPRFPLRNSMNLADRRLPHSFLFLEPVFAISNSYWFHLAISPQPF